MTNQALTFEKGQTVRLKLPGSPVMLINMVSKARETKFGTMYSCLYLTDNKPVAVDVHHNCLIKVEGGEES